MTVNFVPFERHQANHTCTYYLSNPCVCRDHRDMCNGTMKELDLLNIVKVTSETKLIQTYEANTHPIIASHAWLEHEADGVVWTAMVPVV